MNNIEVGDRVYLNPDLYMHDIIPPGFYRVLEVVPPKLGFGSYFRVHNRVGRSKRGIAVFHDEIQCVVKRASHT